LINLPKQYFEKRRREYQNRRDLVYDLLNHIDGVSCSKPEGGLYILLQLPVKDSEDFSKWLLTDFHLNKETIMVTPATDFYATNGKGKNEIRIAYVINKADLAKSINILTKALTVYMPQS
jgi:aspartate aminotransferase